MAEKQILVVDDERLVRQSVAAAFEQEGYTVIQADSGQSALDFLAEKSFDLIILDVYMDGMDGFYVVRVLRNRGIRTPVLFLSGSDEEQSKILGISLGGDDYLTKPFSLALLTTKAQALMRRAQEYSAPVSADLLCGPFRFSEKSYTLFKHDKPVALTAKETALMHLFMQYPGQVFTKEQLYRRVWDQAVIDDNTIMVYMKRLRGKLEDNPKRPKYLRTAWGIGYALESGE